MRGQGLAGRAFALTDGPSRRMVDGMIALSRSAGHAAQATRFVPCASLGVSLDFYRRVLGFTCTFRTAGHAVIERDGSVLRLLEVGYGVCLKDAWHQQICRFDVEDVDAFWATLEPRLRYLPRERVRAPFDGEHGQRAFHVADPDTLLMVFGQLLP